MFISYIWIGWIALAIVGFYMIVLGWSIEALILVSALAYFFIMRISRFMYIHMDVKFDEKYKESVKNV
jgi:hypothetical protein